MKEFRAFPHYGDCPDQASENYYPGITARDYFASKAMQALMSNPSVHIDGQGINVKESLLSFAVLAYDAADALMVVRNHENPMDAIRVESESLN